MQSAVYLTLFTRNLIFYIPDKAFKDTIENRTHYFIIEVHMHFNSSIPLITPEDALVPSPYWAPSRLINHLVLLEESDLDWDNKPHSHFEMYLDAMKQMRVDTTNVENFVELIKKGMSVSDAINSSRLEEGVAQYLKTTHEIVSSGKVHLVAGAFAFSREVVIPQIFSQILDQQVKFFNYSLFHLLVYCFRILKSNQV